MSSYIYTLQIASEDTRHGEFDTKVLVYRYKGDAIKEYRKSVDDLINIFAAFDCEFEQPEVDERFVITESPSVTNIKHYFIYNERGLSARVYLNRQTIL